MSSDRWRRVREVLEGALDRPSEQRDAFLDGACGSDPTLRQEVEAFLASDHDEDSFLESPPGLSEETSLVGRTLSKYEILEAIGHGGMGEVYRARDVTLGREIAVKVLPEELARDEERLSRFKSEARLLAALNHPNIVQLYSVEEASGFQLITMELVRGKTISDAPPDRRDLSAFLDFAITLTDAVASAHGKGITHRDLKPANIMVTDEGRLKVLDFGLAKLSRASSPLGASELETRVHTVEGRIVGTFAYMSPEQAEGKSVDHRSDIFSAGVIFYELLSGKAPFGGDSAAAMLSSTIKDEPKPLSEVRAELPRGLSRLVHRCLVKDPERRYQSIQDVRNELEELRLELERGELDPRRREGTSSPSRRTPVVAAALLSAVLGAAAVSIFPTADAPPPVTRWTLPLPEGQRLRFTGRRRRPFDISPDGRTIAYVATDGENVDPARARVFVRPLDRHDATPIPASAGARTVFFSPDSRELAFPTLDGGLWRSALSGGRPVKIGETVPMESAVWGPDDVIVFNSVSLPGKLWRISARGGEPVELDDPHGGTSHIGASFLPDGRHLLAGFMTHDEFAIEVLPLESGGEHREILRRGTLAAARYLSNGQLLLNEEESLLLAPMDPERPEDLGRLTMVLEGVARDVAVSDTGTLVYLPATAGGARIVRFDRGRGESESWTIRNLWSSSPIRLSPDGTRLALTLAGDGAALQRDIAVYDLATGTLTQMTRKGLNRGAVWSPDGRYLAFQSDDDGVEGIFTLSVDEPGDAHPLLQREAEESRVFPLAWTPDGRGVVYSVNSMGGFDLWMTPDGRNEPRPVLSTPANEEDFDFSDDGRFCTFSTNETGQYQIYAREFPDGRTWPVTTDGGVLPVWAGDEIFYWSGDGLMVVQIETEPFRASAPKALLEEPDARSYDVSPDGQSIYLQVEPRQRATELRVVQNWFSELEATVR